MNEREQLAVSNAIECIESHKEGLGSLTMHDGLDMALWELQAVSDDHEVEDVSETRGWGQ